MSTKILKFAVKFLIILTYFEGTTGIKQLFHEYLLWASLYPPNCPGKADKLVAFGAKLGLSVADGWARPACRFHNLLNLISPFSFKKGRPCRSSLFCCKFQFLFAHFIASQNGKRQSVDSAKPTPLRLNSCDIYFLRIAVFSYDKCAYHTSSCV